MNKAKFTIFDSLVFFLPFEKDGVELDCSFKGRQSVKHLIESFRIPHTEIGNIVVNGKSVDFSYIVKDGDHVLVFPITGRFSPLIRIDTDKLFSKNGRMRFLLDNHLGKLALYLRMLGFDTMYRNDFQDNTLADLASQNDRVLLTRDRGLLMRCTVQFGYYLRSKIPKYQAAEILERFKLFDQIKPLNRCLRCNSPLKPVAKEEIIDRLLPLTRRYYHEFHICDACDQIYWKGSHYDKMMRTLELIVSAKWKS